LDIAEPVELRDVDAGDYARVEVLREPPQRFHAEKLQQAGRVALDHRRRPPPAGWMIASAE